MRIANVLTRCEGEFTASTPKLASANAHQFQIIPNHFYRWFNAQQSRLMIKQGQYHVIERLPKSISMARAGWNANMMSALLSIWGEEKVQKSLTGCQ